MLDVTITGGEVVDGTGAQRRHADVGIRAGRVVAVGSVDEPARRTLDAAGLVVAPGFVDVHTHYDAQLFWDPYLMPSSLHGITTVFGGNCGFSIAPLGPGSAEYLLPMLARVEGMSVAALEAGVPWDWTSTADFLGRLEGRVGVNAGFMVGHSAIRRLVMGPAAVERVATDDEISRMQVLLRAGLAAGGIGLSSSWGTAHLDADDQPVPSRHASLGELVALAGECRGAPGTSLEFIPPGATAQAFYPEDVEVLTAISAAAARPVNWNAMVLRRPGDYERALAKLGVDDAARPRGGRVVALHIAVDAPVRFSFLSEFALAALPGWAETIGLAPDAKLRALRDPVRRKELEVLSAQADDRVAVGKDWGAKVITETFTPGTRRFEGRRVDEIAAAEGKSAFDALVDIACADDLRTTFDRAGSSVAGHEIWEDRIRLCRDRRSLIGASDAGAHLDLIATFAYPTAFLAGAVRQHGVVSLEEAVHLLTQAPARLYGLVDRGTLTPGARADVVIFDEDTVAPGPVTTRSDLPGGASRLHADAVGIRYVLVNGEEILVDGAPTGALPGTILRSGTDLDGTTLPAATA